MRAMREERGRKEGEVLESSEQPARGSREEETRNLVSTLSRFFALRGFSRFAGFRGFSRPRKPAKREARKPAKVREARSAKIHENPRKPAKTREPLFGFLPAQQRSQVARAAEQNMAYHY